METITKTAVAEMMQWRHGFHRRPELGFEVHSTAATVANALQSFGLNEVHTEIGTSGVVGVLRRGSSSNAIGLRADMDALPIAERTSHEYRSEADQIFHGCGHDGHTAMLLGAAKYLAEHGVFDGTVYFIFQPNEENGKGALAMIADGLFERFPISAIYGMHNKPGITAADFATRVGPMMSSEDLFEITINGQGGHASMPERLIDPVIIATEVIQALQTIVSRSVSATETVVLSVTEILTDGARNIVPSNVIIKGDCRTFSAKAQATVEQRMRQLADGICTAHGGTATVEYSHEFVRLINTANEVRSALEAASSVVGESRVEAECALVTASEDFAQYLKHVPGCFIDIGNGLEGSCGKTLHNPEYDFNDEILATGASYWIQLAEQELR